MEFFLVPLIAIIVVTYAIYKLTALIFHIHLSSSLLILLVVFAWLISLVLPGLFFQTAGFLGSVGISLVSAVGFAWLATTYDARRNAEQLNPVSATGDNSVTEPLWTPPAEASFPIEPRFVRKEFIGEEPLFISDVDASAEELIAESIPDIETSDITVLPPAETPRLGSPEERTTESMDDKKEPALSPIVASNSWFEVEDFSSIADAVMFDESDEIMLEIRPESLEMAEIPVDVAGQGGTQSVESINTLEIISPEMDASSVERPASDSLDDLLEFAFEQRSRNNGNVALVTFRLIKNAYGDSHALPLAVAEIVSTLQSSGRYDEAVAELSEALTLPAISQDVRLVWTFEKKMAYLQVLQAFLTEQGTPALPFEQIPAEWANWVEQRVLAGNRVQS